MPVWPLRNRQKVLPQNPEAGSFWEDRSDRHHCGLDLYAAAGSDVLSIETGVVTETGIMTAPELIHYWNVTHYIIIQNETGTFWKYGEMSEIFVQKGDIIKEGQLIGKVGLVLNSTKIDDSSPRYIQKLKDKNPSMLHLELYSHSPIGTHEKYLGGNWFDTNPPRQLMNPCDFLKNIPE
jgi:murein DD-endopeptidase MepM/ murein hydrolase activator NlpD